MVHAGNRHGPDAAEGAGDFEGDCRRALRLVHIGLIAMMSSSGAELFNHTCFNYPTFGDLYLYKDATYEAIFKQTSSSDILKISESLQR